MKKLIAWRQQIDQIDQKILKLLAKRFFVVAQIGQFKKKKHLPAFDPKRWREVVKTRVLAGQKLGLSKSFIKKIYEVIHQQSLKIEK